MYTTPDKVDTFYANTRQSTDKEAMIKAVSAWLDKKLGYKVAYDLENGTPVDLFFDGSGTSHLSFGKFPFNDFGEVLEDDIDITDQVKMYPLNEDYNTSMSRKRGTTTSSIFNTGNGNITITDAKVGRWVYDWETPADTTIPEDLIWAVTVLVAGIIKTDEGVATNSGVVASETFGTYSISYDNSSVKTDSLKAFAIIEAYSNPKFA